MQTALVTGATRGIGCEVVRQLAALGFKVFATGRDQALLRELRAGTGCLGEPCDLADPVAVVNLYARAREALGRVDVLVNNAGFNHRKDPLVDVRLEDFEAQYAVNLRAPFLLCREALREMGARRQGHIVNVISTVAKARLAHYTVYSAMKYGFDGFTGCLAKEAREVNVKVTAIYPGGVNTGFRPNARPDYLRPDSTARMIIQCITAPDDVVVHELVFRPMVETNF